MTNRINRAWLFAACAAAAVGCTAGDPETQVLTGRVQTSGALAVRAVTDDTVITAAAVRTDGSFTLALPVGQRYRLEVLTTSGVRHVVATNNGTLTALSFKVCDPSDPFDIGGIGPDAGMGGGDCDPMDPNCKSIPCDAGDPSCGDWPCQPGDPSCEPPPMCGPNDPMCEPPAPCEPGDPNCKPPPPPCDPNDPSCGWSCEPGDPMCDPCAFGTMDPGCQPPPPVCTDPTDPYCACDANGECPPPTCAPGDEMCPPPPPPPCSDPMDPNTCKDPCVEDPAQCGCSSTDPDCWPPPQPPECANGTCDPDGGWMTPEHPPLDFGCSDPGTMEPDSTEPGPAMEPGTK